MFNQIIRAYQQFEPYELSPFQVHLLQQIQSNDNVIEVFLTIIQLLKNDMYGRYVLLSNTLHYELDIKLKTKTNYSFQANSGLPYRLETQKIDDIRYRIEPLVMYVNEIFAKLTPLQQCQFYSIYIKHLSIEDSGYLKRSLNKAIKNVIMYY